MSFRLWEIFKDPDKRAVISWLGGGAVVVAGGIWTVLAFVVEHKEASGKKGGTTVTMSGQGIASGRDTNIRGNVNIGPSKEQIEQIQKPLAEQLATKDAHIAALAKMLGEKNPSAASGPGAQQALGAAVKSIAQGADEGDPRSKQAFALLEENKIAEATQLLNAVAVDKTAHAEQAATQAEKDRKDAATAYRNLGAIAGLRDPKRALEAYEKALALEPDDLESLFRSGSLLIDYGNLNKAEARLERVLALAKTGDQAYYHYWALVLLGDIKKQRGDLAGALKSYSDGLAIAEPLAKSDPRNALLQRDLSVSYNKVGDVPVAQGDLAGALKSYRDSLAIFERLAKSDPGNAEWQRDLSVANERLGDIFLTQGNLSAAHEQSRASLDRVVPIRDRDPSNADLQHFTSVTLAKVGDVQMQQGNLEAALKSYKSERDIISRLAQSDPGNALWQDDLSISYEKIGDVQMAQGDLQAALKSYQDDLAITERLAQSDPGNAGWQRDLAVSFSKLALVHRQSGDKAKALDALRQGHAIMARLTRLSPDNATWKQDLAWFDKQIAELAPSRSEHGRNPRNPLSRR